jgi:hypothetical protein
VSLARVTQMHRPPHLPHHSAVASVGRLGQNVHIAPAPARAWVEQTVRPICPTHTPFALAQGMPAMVHSECVSPGSSIANPPAGSLFAFADSADDVSERIVTPA